MALSFSLFWHKQFDHICIFILCDGSEWDCTRKTCSSISLKFHYIFASIESIRRDMFDLCLNQKDFTSRVSRLFRSTAIIRILCIWRLLFLSLRLFCCHSHAHFSFMCSVTSALALISGIINKSNWMENHEEQKIIHVKWEWFHLVLAISLSLFLLLSRFDHLYVKGPPACCEFKMVFQFFPSHSRTSMHRSLTLSPTVLVAYMPYRMCDMTLRHHFAFSSFAVAE